MGLCFVVLALRTQELELLAIEMIYIILRCWRPKSRDQYAIQSKKDRWYATVVLIVLLSTLRNCKWSF